VALDHALIAEIQPADVVVLGVPMYNFGVLASLKNWVDAISRATVYGDMMTAPIRSYDADSA
jgi:FMN-dependent NADH-azoreductase